MRPFFDFRYIATLLWPRVESVFAYDFFLFFFFEHGFSACFAAEKKNFGNFCRRVISQELKEKWRWKSFLLNFIFGLGDVSQTGGFDKIHFVLRHSASMPKKSNVHNKSGQWLVYVSFTGHSIMKRKAVSRKRREKTKSIRAIPSFPCRSFSANNFRGDIKNLTTSLRANAALKRMFDKAKRPDGPRITRSGIKACLRVAGGLGGHENIQGIGEWRFFPGQVLAEMCIYSTSNKCHRNEVTFPTTFKEVNVSPLLVAEM